MKWYPKKRFLRVYSLSDSTFSHWVQMGLETSKVRGKIFISDTAVDEFLTGCAVREELSEKAREVVESL